MRALSFIFLGAAVLTGGFAGLDWFSVISKGGSIGVGASALSGTNFLMSIAFGVVAVAFAQLAEAPVEKIAGGQSGDE